MNNAKMGQTHKKLTLTAPQLATMLILEAQMNQLQIGANQLGGFLKLTKEADILVNAIQFIGRQKEALMEEWDRKVQLAPAGAIIEAPKP